MWRKESEMGIKCIRRKRKTEQDIVKDMDTEKGGEETLLQIKFGRDQVKIRLTR
jgi:hypothetical protein